jgi:hypothetical protein
MSSLVQEAGMTAHVPLMDFHQQPELEDVRIGMGGVGLN